MALGVLMVVLIGFVVSRVVTHKVPSDRERIERNIELAFTSHEPYYCDNLTTQAYLEQTTGERRPFADEACESRADQGSTDSVAVEDVEVTGDRASAVVRPSGGSLDGSKLRFGLVQADGYWRLNRVISIDRLDRRGFRRAYRRSFLAFGSPQSSARCAIKRERRLSDAVIEANLLRESGSLFPAIGVECDREGVERSALAAIASPEYGYPAAGVECAERRLKAASNAELVAVETRSTAYGRLLMTCDRRTPFDTLEHGLLADRDRDRVAVECVLNAFRRHSRAQAFRLGYEDNRYVAIVERCENA
jgi:hypothetical protein